MGYEVSQFRQRRRVLNRLGQCHYNLEAAEGKIRRKLLGGRRPTMTDLQRIETTSRDLSQAYHSAWIEGEREPTEGAQDAMEVALSSAFITLTMGSAARGVKPDKKTFAKSFRRLHRKT